LHSARDHARKKQRQEVQICRARVGDYLAKQRRKEEEARRAAEAAERDRQKRENEDRARERDQQKADRKKQEDRDRGAADQAAREDRARRDATAQAEKEQHDRQEKDRQAQHEQEERTRRDAQEQAEQAQLAAEVARQQYLAAVAQTATHVKQEWLGRIRTSLPEVAAEVGSFVEISRSMTRGDGAHSMSEFIGEADTLVTRVETAHAWISSPLETFADQVTADAIRIVKADHGQQETDARLTAIFHGVKKMNDVAHNTNPFAKSISSFALAQIEEQFNTALGNLNHIEKELSAANSSDHKAGGQPLTNPFRLRTHTPSRSTAHSDAPNPFASSSGPPDSILTEPLGSQATSPSNPFRHASTSRQRDADSKPSSAAMSQENSRNPFHKNSEAHSEAGSSASGSTTPKTARQSSEDRTVRYRDPLTKELHTKRRNDLPASASGDDPDGTRCSSDGLGIVTDKCEKVRREPAKRSGSATR
jgi:hypothetical protein